MKCDVHCFAIVRVKMPGIEAESHAAATRKALERFHDLYGLFETANFAQLPEGMSDVEFAEEFSHFLVDEEGDHEHERSSWHNAHGDAVPPAQDKLTDTTEQLRRLRLEELSRESDRKTLEQRYGKVWNSSELRQEFKVIGFMAPYVVARRKSDNIRGSLEFQHHPRFFFNWREDSIQDESRQGQKTAERRQCA